MIQGLKILVSTVQFCPSALFRTPNLGVLFLLKDFLLFLNTEAWLFLFFQKISYFFKGFGYFGEFEVPAGIFPKEKEDDEYDH